MQKRDFLIFGAIGVGLGVVGIFVLCALPRPLHTRDESACALACNLSLRTITAAKSQLALESNLPPATIVTAAELMSFMGRGKSGKMVTCPHGGTYELNPIGELPACSVTNHHFELKSDAAQSK
jgi:hypothetical protein